MKILIQRVSKAHVEVNSSVIGSIGPGILVFVGFTHSDTFEQVKWLTNKLVNIRIFEDASGKINRSLIDCKGSILIISQFTLYADCSEGRRPGFSQAAPPELAEHLYQEFIEEIRKTKVPIETGIFGAEMKVFLVNDGPVT